MNLNLRTKLIIIILLITIFPLSLLGIYIFKYTTNLMQHELSINEQQYLETLSDQYNYFLKDVEQMSLFFTNNNQLQEILKKDPDRNAEEKYDDIQTVQELFKTVKGIKEWDIDIYIIDNNGERYFSNSYLPQKYDDIREEWGIFRNMKNHNGAITWDTSYSFDRMYPENVALSAGRTLNDYETGAILGYIIIDINEGALAAFYNSHLTNQDEHFYIIDHQGYIISSDDKNKEIGTKLQATYVDRILKGNNGYFNYNADGIPSVISYYTTSNDTNIKLISIKPIYSINKKINTIRYLTLSITFLALILAGWLAYLLSRTITNPLYKLMYLMKQVETGDLHVRFSSKYKDDIGKFGDHFNKMLKQLNKLIEDSYEKKIRVKNSELKALRAQINPHFLYNTLDTVNWLARLERTEEISTIVLSLSNIMKYSINTTDQDFVNLETDLQQLKNYLTIQEFRYRDKFNVQVSVDHHLLDKKIPSLLIQPLVENAIIHGQENNTEKGNIAIDIEAQDAEILITIKDDGIGMDAATLEKVTQLQPADEQMGIGIANVKSRLALYYGKSYEFHIVSEINVGTTITIKIPK